MSDEQEAKLIGLRNAIGSLVGNNVKASIYVEPDVWHEFIKDGQIRTHIQTERQGVSVRIGDVAIRCSR